MNKTKQQPPDLKRGHRYLLEDQEGQVRDITVLHVAKKHFHFRYYPHARWVRKEKFLSGFWNPAELQVITELEPLPPAPLTVDQCMAAAMKHAPAQECPKCDGMGCTNGCTSPQWVRALRAELEALAKPTVDE